MRLWQAAGLTALVLAMGWGISQETPPKPDTQAFKVDSTPFARSKETLAASAQATAAAKTSRTPQSHVPAARQWPERVFHYQTELDSFQKIRTKVFLSDAEQQERRRLLNDISLLRALGLRLTEASLAPAVTASQDAAVDLLIEALKSGDKAMASEVAKTVIEDPGVENASTDRSVRENLAGIKAEVLYHWAALIPEDTSVIERSLPGPVSQKIWANVTHRHASNTAESATEISAREK